MPPEHTRPHADTHTHTAATATHWRFQTQRKMQQKKNPNEQAGLKQIKDCEKVTIFNVYIHFHMRVF